MRPNHRSKESVYYTWVTGIKWGVPAHPASARRSQTSISALKNDRGRHEAVGAALIGVTKPWPQLTESK
jgi:hypothetical protein